ncbi:uncharacterized protein LOC132932794 [Metopolophium dirhodum]|uniref:uncharacterized protein LOC132932794 n=1 Tax=Metopolophium dirhodum TaxID=44670 RepID=UPI00298FCF9F|nr:uncharacterized protein LOC132932794 [Metopolophium dirhodum]
MITEFHITVRPILFVSKCMGLIDISYTVEPSGLLVQNKNSNFHALLEIARMIVLLVCTYIYFNEYGTEFHILRIISIVQFWNAIVAARLSTILMIKCINGIIEFDRKITLHSTNLLIPQRSWTKTHWNTILISLFTYFIGFKCLQIYFCSLQMRSITFLIHHVLFTAPFVMDYVVTISSCFFLQNMYVRFQTLNDLWKCLPADLVPISDQWTHIKIVVFMENMRLLHAELCDLLKMFTLGYGPMLLSLFIFSFINMILSIYINFSHILLSSVHSNNHSLQIVALLVHVQIVTFLISIVILVSFINEKRLKMISCLRLYRISNLHFDIKRQIKMFMNQISVCASDQISAFGFFDINLNLVTSILVLLISGIITLIQMKDHPMILKLNNDTYSLFQKLRTRN